MAERAHPEADAARHMDGIYRYQRYIYDASRKYFLLGRDRMLDGLAVPAGGTVLEVGCGTGRNLILAARRYPHARLYGFDISRVMLDTACKSIARAGLADRVTVVEGDATDFDPAGMFGVPSFDRVYISYALSMIPPWRAALDRSFAAVKPGGSLHIVDFGEQAGLPRWFRAGLRSWLAKFTVEPRADLEAQLHSLALRENAAVAFERLHRDYAHIAVVARPKS